jgi:hypothetical protein
MRRCVASARQLSLSSLDAPPGRSPPRPSRVAPSGKPRRRSTRHRPIRRRSIHHRPTRCPANRSHPRHLRRRRRPTRRLGPPSHARRRPRHECAPRGAEPCNRYACWASSLASFATATAGSGAATNATVPESACTRDPIPRRRRQPEPVSARATPAGARRPSTTDASSRRFAWIRLTVRATAVDPVASRRSIAPRSTARRWRGRP